MAEVSVVAPAKINLYLRAGSPRPDGYHPLLTVFQAVSLFERVTLRLAGQPGVAISVTGPGANLVPLDQSNLAVRAVLAVAEQVGLTPAVQLHIDKAVPVAGGLAGGSADAAAALVAANHLWQAGLDHAALHRLAAGLGSDVNFCLAGGTAIGHGRGEQLAPINPGAPSDPSGKTALLHWVLATRPDTGLSTPAMFTALDRVRAGARVELPGQVSAGLIEALQQGNPTAVGRHLANDLQAPAVAALPELASTLEVARTAGALGAVVTGSGPTVAALAADAAHAAHLAQAVASADRAVQPIVVTAPVPGPLADPAGG